MDQTGIKKSDIVYLLESLQILRYHQGEYMMVATEDTLRELVKLSGNPGLLVKRENIHWVPHIKQ